MTLAPAVPSSPRAAHMTERRLQRFRPMIEELDNVAPRGLRGDLSYNGYRNLSPAERAEVLRVALLAEVEAEIAADPTPAPAPAPAPVRPPEPPAPAPDPGQHFGARVAARCARCLTYLPAHDARPRVVFCGRSSCRPGLPPSPWASA